MTAIAFPRKILKHVGSYVLNVSISALVALGYRWTVNSVAGAFGRRPIITWENVLWWVIGAMVFHALWEVIKVQWKQGRGEIVQVKE